MDNSYYTKLYQDRLRENVNKVLFDLEKEYMRKKIFNWSSKFGYSFEEIKQKIYTDKIFRCVFAMDDGDYYLTKDSKNNYETKFARLCNIVNEKTAFVLTINELGDFLKKFV